MCLAVLVFVLLPSCGKKKSATANISVNPTQSHSQRAVSRPEVPPLDELLEQLRELQKPPQVEPQLWCSLKSALRERLIARFGNGKGVSSYPYQAPKTHDYVKARDLVWEPGGTYGKLKWYYVNDGDYDQGSQVAIEDITRLAMHMDERVTAGMPASDGTGRWPHTAFPVVYYE